MWADQPRYCECWLEKDALSGIFEEVLEPYGVTLNVGRGFDGWEVRSVRRENNVRADELVNEALDARASTS